MSNTMVIEPMAHWWKPLHLQYYEGDTVLISGKPWKVQKHTTYRNRCVAKENEMEIFEIPTLNNSGTQQANCIL